MGVAYFVVADREVPGFHPVEAIPDGKSVARATEHLDALAAAAGVRSLLDFTRATPEEAASIGGWIAPEDREPDMPYPGFGGDEPPGPDQIPPEQWFDPADGLTVVRALISGIEADPAAMAAAIWREHSTIGTEDVLADLRHFNMALGRLDAAGVRWHLAIDF